MKSLYHYAATLISAYDGDTARFDVDLGFHTWLRNINCRFARIDAPEIRGASDEEEALGREARDYVRNVLASASNAGELVISTHKSGKFGRWIAEVFVHANHIGDASGLPDEAIIDGHYINVSDLLVHKGYAVYREEWGD